MPKLKKPLQQVNTHKVPARQWKKWPDICQRVFNETFGTMTANKNLFFHPGQDEPRDEYFKTTAWNAAWTAADATLQALKDIEAGRCYARA